MTRGKAQAAWKGFPARERLQAVVDSGGVVVAPQVLWDALEESEARIAEMISVDEYRAMEYRSQVAEDALAEAQARIERLEQWKSEAIRVLVEWDLVFDALGRPGRLGDSKAVAARVEVGKAQARIAAVEKVAAEWSRVTGPHAAIVVSDLRAALGTAAGDNQ